MIYELHLNKSATNFFINNPMLDNLFCSIFEIYFRAVSTSKNTCCKKESFPLDDHQLTHTQFPSFDCHEVFFSFKDMLFLITNYFD